LIEPAVMPATKCRCRNAQASTIGTDAITTPVNSSG
jgi:hypothetical protein